MTPERIAEIARQHTMRRAELDGMPLIDFIAEDRTKRAIRQAVNEALSEAKQCADSEAMFWDDCDDKRANKAARLIADNIDALKLPEEP